MAGSKAAVGEQGKFEAGRDCEVDMMVEQQDTDTEYLVVVVMLDDKMVDCAACNVKHRYIYA